jgi:hypothetical protein
VNSDVCLTGDPKIYQDALLSLLFHLIYAQKSQEEGGEGKGRDYGGLYKGATWTAMRKSFTRATNYGAVTETESQRD